MKKLLKNLFFFSAVGSVAILASCGGDDEVVVPDAPSIEVDVTGSETVEVTGTEISAVQGDSVHFAVDVSSPGGFNVVTFSVAVGDGTPTTTQQSRTDLGLDAGATEAEASFYIILDDEDFVDADITVTIEAVDDENQTAQAVYGLTVAPPPSPDARSYTAVLLYAPLADESSDAFFSTSTGMTYSPDDVNATTDPVSATLDFGYYHGATDGASLASIAAYAELPVAVFADQVTSFGTKNGTVFKETTLDAGAFAEVVTWADIDAAFEEAEGEGDAVVTGLVEGQVLAFETDEDKEGGAKRGLILVSNIEGTFNEGDYIELEILVQEEVED